MPIVEPEVLMDGAHTIERCEQVTTDTLHALFAALYEQRVVLEGTLLKPNMVLSGKDCAVQASVDEVAEATIACFRATVPAAVPGIVFLSGGQSDEVATAHLDAMNRRGPHPWELSFSYGRRCRRRPSRRGAAPTTAPRPVRRRTSSGPGSTARRDSANTRPTSRRPCGLRSRNRPYISRRYG